MSRITKVEELIPNTDYFFVQVGTWRKVHFLYIEEPDEYSKKYNLQRLKFKDDYSHFFSDMNNKTNQLFTTYEEAKELIDTDQYQKDLSEYKKIWDSYYTNQ